MIKESITNLIDEMKEVKQENDALEISDVLRIFAIDAQRRLAIQTRRLVNG